MEERHPKFPEDDEPEEKIPPEEDEDDDLIDDTGPFSHYDEPFFSDVNDDDDEDDLADYNQAVKNFRAALKRGDLDEARELFAGPQIGREVNILVDAVRLLVQTSMTSHRRAQLLETARKALTGPTKIATINPELLKVEFGGLLRGTMKTSKSSLTKTSKEKSTDVEVREEDRGALSATFEGIEISSDMTEAKLLEQIKLFGDLSVAKVVCLANDPKTIVCARRLTLKNVPPPPHGSLFWKWVSVKAHNTLGFPPSQLYERKPSRELLWALHLSYILCPQIEFQQSYRQACEDWWKKLRH